jgi:L-ascorbate metabolism protein UlaG (beta-lactamase superfamily)
MTPTAVTRITHSCHLIEIGGRTFLTDPWFSERPGYHPGEPAALAVADLPRLDAVLISHHHYDHCDLKALRGYRDLDVPMLVAGPVAARAGDTLLIPELAQLPQRVGHIDVALLPTNGLRIRPQANKQVVMDAAQAAELAAILVPQLAVPHHYAFTSGWLGDRLLTKSDRDPEHFARAARELAPGTEVRITGPGTRVAL